MHKILSCASIITSAQPAATARSARSRTPLRCRSSIGRGWRSPSNTSRAHALELGRIVHWKMHASLAMSAREAHGVLAMAATSQPRCIQRHHPSSTTTSPSISGQDMSSIMIPPHTQTCSHGQRHTRRITSLTSRHLQRQRLLRRRARAKKASRRPRWQTQQHPRLRRSRLVCLKLRRHRSCLTLLDSPLRHKRRSRLVCLKLRRHRSCLTLLDSPLRHKRSSSSLLACRHSTKATLHKMHLLALCWAEALRLLCRLRHSRWRRRQTDQSLRCCSDKGISMLQLISDRAGPLAFVPEAQ